jgi:hypothetical protein
LFQETAKADHETRLRIAVNKMMIGIFTETSSYFSDAKNQQGTNREKHPCVAKMNKAM